jgi:hypothetical protein
MLTLFTTPVIYLVMDRLTKSQRSDAKSRRHPLQAAPAE